MTKQEAAVFLKQDLRHTEECILFAMASGHQREQRALQQSAEAYRMAIAALQGQMEKEEQPLTMAELRNMDGQTVYCLELNAEVRVSARKVGWITIHYPLPVEKDCCKAHGLTLYRTKPKEG